VDKSKQSVQGHKEMINEKYKQLCLALQFGGINTIGFIQSLVAK